MFDGGSEYLNADSIEIIPGGVQAKCAARGDHGWTIRPGRLLDPLWAGLYSNQFVWEDNRVRYSATIAIWLILTGCLTGCGPEGLRLRPVDSPSCSEAFKSFDTHGDGRADFFLLANAAGRVDRIGYDVSGAGKPDVVIGLDDLREDQCRHLVIILDGFGYDVVRKYYDDGGLRFCHVPSKVIATYPTMTDLCLADALRVAPCPALQARYYDFKTNDSTGGALAYLASTNEPYNRVLGYRAEKSQDGLAFLQGWPVFQTDLRDLMRAFNKSPSHEIIGYLVSSAAISTRDGAAGQRKCLEQVDLAVAQILWQTHGLVKVTIFADHGHGYKPPIMVDFETLLKARGWHFTDHLHEARDVSFVPMGVVTEASFNARRPALLAADLAECSGVELASFVEGDQVVVLSHDHGRATIRKIGRGYTYQAAAGDPLQLHEALAGLTADAQGAYDADQVLKATVNSAYPAAPERLWRAHFGLVENPGNVLVSLQDDRCSGLNVFKDLVAIASTHGSLNRINSTTFIMSTLGPLPPVMRSRDIPANMTQLLGVRWPETR